MKRLIAPLVLFLVLAPAGLASAERTPVVLCHATGSESNPFVTIEIDDDGLHGHEGHEGDIIPAPAEGCPVPEPKPTPTVTETIKVEVPGPTVTETAKVEVPGPTVTTVNTVPGPTVTATVTKRATVTKTATATATETVTATEGLAKTGANPGSVGIAAGLMLAGLALLLASQWGRRRGAHE